MKRSGFSILFFIFSLLCIPRIQPAAFPEAIATIESPIVTDLAQLKKMNRIGPHTKPIDKIQFLSNLITGLETQKQMVDAFRIFVTSTNELESRRIDHNAIMYMLGNPTSFLTKEGLMLGGLDLKTSSSIALWSRHRSMISNILTHAEGSLNVDPEEAFKILNQFEDQDANNKELAMFVCLLKNILASQVASQRRFLFGVRPIRDAEFIFANLPKSATLQRSNSPLSTAYNIFATNQKMTNLELGRIRPDPSILITKKPENLFINEKEKIIRAKYEKLRPSLEALYKQANSELEELRQQSFIKHFVPKKPQKKPTQRKKAPAKPTPQKSSAFAPESTTKSEITAKFPPSEAAPIPLPETSSTSSASSSSGSSLPVMLPEQTIPSQATSSSASSSSGPEPLRAEEVGPQDNDILKNFFTETGDLITLFKVENPQTKIHAPTSESYTPTIRRWLENPRTELHRQLTDPFIAESKKSKMRKDEAATIFMHSFPTQVEASFDCCSTLATIVDRRTKEPINVVTMSGSIRDVGGRTRFLIFRWLFDKTGRCFHREASEISSFELMKKLMSNQPLANYQDIPELYAEEFPPLR